MKIAELYLIFFIYSFIGWLWESFPCSKIELDKIYNRGFLIGPFCPIYGIGATVSYLILKNFDSSFYIFIYSALLSCTIEYVIGYLLERFFHQRWWDYGAYPFQIKRRVCLYGLIVFGMANIIIVKYLTPVMLLFFSAAEDKIINSVAFLLTFIFVIDLLLTLNNLLGLSKSLDKIYCALDARSKIYFNYLNESDRISNLKLMSESKKFKVKFENFNSNLKEREEILKKIDYTKIKDLFSDNF
ncbi:putative ABC transporter permease [Peptoniphilus sp. AGMB00490]|uniref:ABC transporter permease n=2 Tax=Peptoniphilus TaxID=162289 RepID=A0ACD6AZ85_9FIRM|nr:MULTISPECIES: putative ABC transporter permease [Peptoniphilus]NMW85953.1 putative ABC transporter permease [Peptoniphilus faecalis]OLR64688.1 hypothetical protein BIV18_03620 [Peptoniphilus porci]